MSFVNRDVVNITTAADGSATVYSNVLTGKIATIAYVKPGSNGLDAGVDFTITAEATGESILAVTNVAASTSWAPRQATHSTAGAAALYAAAGTAVNDHIAIANDRVKIVVAQGGNALNGAIHVTLV